MAEQPARPASGGHQRLARGVAATGLGQSFVGFASGVQAVLVGALIGTTAGTDGFFAAYGLYTLVGVFAQSWRTTIVARLTESPSQFSAFNRFCGAAAVIFLASGVIFVGLGGPVSALLGGSLPPEARTVARETLLILWPAAGAQMLAALAASMLGLLGNYSRAAIAYSAGSAVSIVAFLLLQPSLGLTALSVAILIGTIISAGMLLVSLARAGWRPSPAIIFELRANTRVALLLLGASTTNALVYLSYLISLTFAARLGEGAVTIYSYAYFGLQFVTTFVSSSVMIVLAAPIASTWDRRPRSLRPYYDDVFRTGLMIVLPVVAAALLVGQDVASALLRQFSHRDAQSLITVFLILTPGLVTAIAVTIPSVALFTLGRYRARATVAFVVVVLHALFCAIAVSTDKLAALALAGMATSLTGTIGVLWLLYGRAFTAVVARLAGQLLSVAVPAALCFGLAALAFNAIAVGTVAEAGAFVLGLLLYGGWIAAFMPPHRVLATRLVHSLRASAAGQG